MFTVRAYLLLCRERGGMGLPRGRKGIFLAAVVAAVTIGVAALLVLVTAGALTPATASVLAGLGTLAVGVTVVSLWTLRIARRIGRFQQAQARRAGQLSRGAVHARERAGRLFADGHIGAAVDELTPYTTVDPAADGMRRRYLSERRALGPLPPLPPPPLSAPTTVPGRVLHLVTNSLPVTRAGYTVRTQRILTAQRAAGLDPHAVTFAGYPTPKDKDTAPLIEVEGIPYHRITPGEHYPGMQERIDDSIRGVTALAKELRPAVLHAASGNKNATIALNVGRALGIPVVYELRGLLEESWLAREGSHDRRGSEWYRLTLERETSLAREADAVVTLAETMRQRILERGVDPERITLALNAVDESLLTERPDGDAFRARHGIAPEEFVVGSVSSLHAYEGFATLIDAVALMHENDRAVRVLLVGDGKVRAELLQRAERLGIREACVLPGRVDPVEALQAQAALDVMVVPRVDAGVTRLVTPLKPVEAMAYGVPVVASDLPALRELLADGRAGTLVPPGDASSLADAVTRLRKDDVLREEKVAAALEEVRTRRTWPRVVEAYRDLYGRLGALD